MAMGDAGLRRAAFWAMVITLLVAAIVSFATALSWLDRPYPGFKLRMDRAVEMQLPPQSTGAQAGLMPGDRIVAVDGKALEDPRDLYAYVATRPVGTPLAYDLERHLPNGATTRMTKVIATQAHDVRLWASTFLALWITGISFLVLGSLVSVLKPGDPLATANLAFHLAGTAALLTVFDQSTTFLSPFQDTSKLLQWFIALFFTNFALQFPRRHPALEGARRVNVVVGLVLAVVLVACHETDRGLFWVTFGHLAYIALGELVLLANSLWTYFSPRSTPSEKGQSAALLVGTLLSTVPALIVPQAQTLGLAFDLEGLENFALPLWPLAISYAIVRHQLFDLTPFLKRSITYAISVSVLTVLYFLSAGATQAVLGDRTKLPSIVATALVALAFVPVRDRVKRWLDARFFRSPYRFDEVIAAFTRTAQETVQAEVLIEAYLETLEQSLAPTRVALVLDRDGLRPFAGRGCTDAERSALATMLAAGFPPPQGKPWEILPLVVQDHVLGHAAIGPKKSDLPYTELDRALFKELTQLLAVWLNLFERFEKVRLQSQEIEALRRSEAMQGQFLNMVSHELKVPLSVILGSLSILKRHEQALDEKSISQHDRIRRSLTHLIGLVGDLLNAGQLQSGHFRLRTRSLELGTVAKDMVAEMRGLADQKGHTLALSLPPELPEVCGDRTRLEQVFRNLIHNAIRYTPANGLIQVRVGLEGHQVRCEVQDNGPGIESTALPALFQRFSQVHAEALDRDQGVGLGLFIAKAIVEAHGGTIGVESLSGVGTTFWFTVPLFVEGEESVPFPALSESC